MNAGKADTKGSETTECLAGNYLRRILFVAVLVLVLDFTGDFENDDEEENDDDFKIMRFRPAATEPRGGLRLV